MHAPISSGAESLIYLNDHHQIEKHRIQKKYRITEIDEPLRFSRTKRELRVMEKLTAAGLPVPQPISATKDTIIMEHIAGAQLKTILDRRPELAASIGKHLSLMHRNNIIHGDLTTSNMILAKNNTLYFIDFGLSYISTRVEDKAVDIHLFKQALESRHFQVAKKAYAAFLKGYLLPERDEILARLTLVEERGRYKEKSA